MPPAPLFLMGGSTVVPDFGETLESALWLLSDAATLSCFCFSICRKVVWRLAVVKLIA